ncbi:MAG TPA: hypothetical protein VGS97_20230 [Actinocrinis sp.]|uniref:hypothetical protein n=1 Tax=Actinocrinis sp. TaxID=1920516 RepID=UPI002DDDBCF3|nr:hypothetical protein [Actinocrinis sp.]HEV2346438.1 hypothetical protein [Actinocrinis sp.]
MSEEPRAPESAVGTPFVLQELEHQVHSLTTNLLMANARSRELSNEVFLLQEQNVALQKRVTEYEDRDGAPDAA